MPLMLTTHAKAYIVALPVLMVLSATGAAWHSIDDALHYGQATA